MPLNASLIRFIRP